MSVTIYQHANCDKCDSGFCEHVERVMSRRKREETIAEECEGVAAPLEPGQLESEARKFRIIDKGFRDGTMLSGTWIDKVMAEFAAAVSKNLQEELANAKRMLYELTPEDIRGMAYDANALLEARVAELEKEIAALRETK